MEQRTGHRDTFELLNIGSPSMFRERGQVTEDGLSQLQDTCSDVLTADLPH